jgi:hypothetical protein
LFLFETGIRKNGANGDVLSLRNGFIAKNFYADVSCSYNVASKRIEYDFRSKYGYIWNFKPIEVKKTEKIVENKVKQGGSDEKLVQKWMQNLRSWAKKERCRKFDIETKFKINDSSKLMSESLDKNLDFMVSINSVSVETMTPNTPKNATKTGPNLT